MKYDLTFLSTEGWKQYKISTEKSTKEIKEYLASPYTNKVHLEPADGYGYLPLEGQISEHPRFKIPSDKALKYFKETKHDYVDAECFALKNEWEERQKKKERAKKQVERMVFR